MDLSFCLVFAAAAGAVRCAASLLVEHPLDVVKTYWQAHPKYRSTREVVRIIRELRGLSGFYAGLIPNTIRVMSKQAYRYPLMLALPLMYQSSTDSVLFVSILTGLTIAVLEVFLITPLERLKVWLMTFQERVGGLRQFFQVGRRQFVVFVYRGLSVTMVRQILSWVTFLITHDQMMLFVRDALGIQKIGFLHLMWISLAEALINTLVMLPVDEIKSRLQRVGSRHGALNEVRYIYITYGIRGFYVAYHIRVLQYMIHSAFTVSLLESLRRMI